MKHQSAIDSHRRENMRELLRAMLEHIKERERSRELRTVRILQFMLVLWLFISVVRWIWVRLP